MSYDDGKYGVINRKWFGLTKKHGGDVADGYTFGTTDATSQTAVARWYPKGDISIQKIGAMVLASVTAGSQDYTDRIPVRVLTRGASASVAGTFSLDIDGGTMTQFTFASNESPTVRRCKAGEYISIKSGTPQTANGTAANTATTAGTVAYFIDYAARPVPASEWKVTH
jgi:hypothetical protein